MIIKFDKFFESYDKNNDYYYIIKDEKFLICDIGACSKSDRTFDMKFYDLVENKKLIEVLFPKYNMENINLEDFASHLVRFDHDKFIKLTTKNPKLRLLIQDPNLFIDVLEIFHPDDIRVRARKYNL